MPHIGAPSDYIPLVEQDLARREFEDPQEAASDIALPPRYELLKRFSDLSAHIYDNPRETASHLADRAVITAALVESDANPAIRVASIFHDLSAAQRAQDDADRLLRQHEVWKETPLDLFIRQPGLERRQSVGYADKDTNTSKTGPEDDVSLDLRRYFGQSLFISSLEHARVEHLIAEFNGALNPDLEPEQQQTALIALAKEQLKPENDKEPVADVKVKQARAALMAGLNGDYSADVKTSLLNLALDTAMEHIDTLPEEDSIAGAEAYLVSGRAVHDLASRHKSFPQLSEADAREFRVRALELAHSFVDQAVEMYKKIFDRPIGPVNATTYRDVSDSIRTLEHETALVNEALWFRGVYEDDARREAESLSQKVRSIGRSGIIHALTSSLPRADVPQELIPQASELAMAA